MNVNNEYPPVVLAIGYNETLRRAAHDWAFLYGREPQVRGTGHDGLRYVATNRHSSWLVLVAESVADMSVAAVLSTTRDLVGPSADVVALYSGQSELVRQSLLHAGASWTISRPRQILHPAAPLHTDVAGIYAA